MKIKSFLNKISISQSDIKIVEIRKGLGGEPICTLRSYEIRNEDYKGTDNLTINYFAVSDRMMLIYVKE